MDTHRAAYVGNVLDKIHDQLFHLREHFETVRESDPLAQLDMLDLTICKQFRKWRKDYGIPYRSDKTDVW